MEVTFDSASYTHSRHEQMRRSEACRTIIYSSFLKRTSISRKKVYNERADRALTPQIGIRPRRAAQARPIARALSASQPLPYHQHYQEPISHQSARTSACSRAAFLPCFAVCGTTLFPRSSAMNPAVLLSRRGFTICSCLRRTTVIPML